MSFPTNRLQVIMDNDITCHIPSLAPPESAVSVDYCRISVKLAQISQRVWDNLSSATSLHQSPDSLLRALSELDRQLQELRASCKDLHSPSGGVGSSITPRCMSLDQAIGIRYQFYGVTFDLHTAATSPWSCRIGNLSRHRDFQTRVEDSSATVATACREAILLTSQLNLTAATPRT